MGFFNQISACACYSEGSSSSICDKIGHCNCKNGFDGVKCDRCHISYGGFPTCHYGGKFVI